MKNGICISFAIALMAVAQIACAANANLGAPTPLPTAQSPQVIVVQQPAQQPARDDGTGMAIVVLVAVLVMGGMAGAATAAYLAGKRSATSDTPQSLTLTTHNYYTQQSMPPAQLTEAEQFRMLRQQGFTPEAAYALIAQCNAGQIMLPPQQ